MPEYTSGRISRLTEAKIDRAKTVPLEKAVNRGPIGPPPKVNPAPTPTHGSQTSGGATDELRNLITFCSSCHDAVELATEAAGSPLSWEVLTAPPSIGQDKEKRLWFIDKKGRVSAVIIK